MSALSFGQEGRRGRRWNPTCRSGHGTPEPCHDGPGRCRRTADPLIPAKGFLTRRSYRVDAGPYRLVPCSLGESRVLLDGEQIGVFTSVGDGRVWFEWQNEGRRTPDDAAVGYALAAAFGTGAEPMWKLNLDAALSLFG